MLREGSLGTLQFPAELAYCEIVDPATGQALASDGAGGAHHHSVVRQRLAAAALRNPRPRRAGRAGACPCGRPLPGIRAGGVQRYDDMLRFRGVNVWPASFDSAVFSVAGVLNYQGTVRRDAEGNEMTDIVLECESGAQRGRVTLGGRSSAAESGLGVRVSTVEPGHITREIPEGFVQLKRWRDLRSIDG